MEDQGHLPVRRLYPAHQRNVLRPSLYIVLTVGNFDIQSRFAPCYPSPQLQGPKIHHATHAATTSNNSARVSALPNPKAATPGTSALEDEVREAHFIRKELPRTSLAEASWELEVCGLACAICWQ